MVNIQFETGNNSVIFTIKKSIYPLNVIMKTAYNFTNNFYIFFDYTTEDCIGVQIKSKALLSDNELDKTVGEFYNELLNQSIRYDIQNRTSDLRQLILGRALYTECIETKEGNGFNQIKGEPVENTSTMDTNKDYINDTYQIATCWNENVKFEGDK